MKSCFTAANKKAVTEIHEERDALNKEAVGLAKTIEQNLEELGA
ncbi:MAG TPA: hypothetical protein VF988_11795 [Verrucomicrobiae bacterium]